MAENWAGMVAVVIGPGGQKIVPVRPSGDPVEPFAPA